MWETVFNFMIFLLAIYGALVLVASILSGIKSRKSNERSSSRLILMVKNDEEFIEGIVKNIFRQELLSSLMTDGKLIVMDMGSSDNTMDILLRLKSYYINMEIIDENERDAIFSGFEKNP